MRAGLLRRTDAARALCGHWRPSAESGAHLNARNSRGRHSTQGRRPDTSSGQLANCSTANRPPSKAGGGAQSSRGVVQLFVEPRLQARS